MSGSSRNASFRRVSSSALLRWMTHSAAIECQIHEPERPADGRRRARRAHGCSRLPLSRRPPPMLLAASLDSASRRPARRRRVRSFTTATGKLWLQRSLRRADRRRPPGVRRRRWHALRQPRPHCSPAPLRLCPARGRSVRGRRSGAVRTRERDPRAPHVRALAGRARRTKHAARSTPRGALTAHRRPDANA